MTNETGSYPHPPLDGRHGGNQSAAVSAFHRLYLYARESGKSALAIFAVYKGLQKIEERIDKIQDVDLLGGPADAIIMPPWIRDGLWFAMETYLIHPQQRGITEKKRVIEFKAALRSEWDDYLLWFAVKKHMVDNESSSIDPAVKPLVRRGLSADTLRRAYKRVEQMFKDANTMQVSDSRGVTLSHVQPRDIVPTQRLLAIFERLAPTDAKIPIMPL